MGVQLGVDMDMIKCIQENNTQWPSPQEKAFQMLLTWHEKGSASTTEQLIAALIHVGRQDLAENLDHLQVHGLTIKPLHVP